MKTSFDARLSRRRFLKHSAQAAAVSLAAASCVSTLRAASTPAATALVGTQLYGWGQYYQRDQKKLEDHLGEVLSAIRDCGYDYAESSMDSGNLENNVKFADLLKSKGMKPVSLYTGGRLHERATAEKNVESLLKAADACKRSGFSIINCNPDPIGREKTDAELETQVAALKKLGAGLREMGMRLGIHHHTPEMRSDGREFHYNFRNSKAGVIDFCFDVHWVYRGGLAPMEALKEYGDRVVSWHLRQSRRQIWWEDLADGDIDYQQIARMARERKLAPYYTVELALEGETKITRSVVENHRRSREYVRQVFGA